ncbi:MAG TPA: cytochrome c oxidase assembly protein [Solirubrobacteraceae bacterium]|nr:cytochrome c oxidase assembly protein [Solirubrobacteraceae bacterium]
MTAPTTVGPPLALAAGVIVAVQLAPLVLLALLYARRARTLARGRHAVPIWRQSSFYAGVFAIAVLFAAGQSRGQLLLLHTVENLVLIDFAPLLIVLGTTTPLIAPLIRLDALRRLSFIANPLIAFPLWAADLYLWHAAPLYQAALEHPGWHLLQHTAFVLCGINLWLCLFGPLPKPSWFGDLGRFLYILAICLSGAALGNIFLWSGTVFYLRYMHSDAVHHISPLADQNLAGAAMLIACALLAIGLFYWMFRRSARESREREDLLDLARLHGVPLSERRAARAVTAGRGGELRNRLERNVKTLS